MRSPLEHLEHIRTKPEHIRRRAAIMATFLIGGSIALTWGSYQSKKLTLLTPTQKAVLAAQENQAQAASPFAALQNIFTGTNTK